MRNFDLNAIKERVDELLERSEQDGYLDTGEAIVLLHCVSEGIDQASFWPVHKVETNDNDTE